MYTTLNKIKSSSPCDKGWKTLLEGLGKTEADDEPLHLLDILRTNGVNDMLWSLRAFSVKEHGFLAVGAARQVQHLCKGAESVIDMVEASLTGLPVSGIKPPSVEELREALQNVKPTVAYMELKAELAIKASIEAAIEAVRSTAVIRHSVEIRTLALNLALRQVMSAAEEEGLCREETIRRACDYVELRLKLN